MSPKTPPTAPSPKNPATRGLGRGLSSLLGDSGIANATGAIASLSDAASAPAPFTSDKLVTRRLVGI